MKAWKKWMSIGAYYHVNYKAGLRAIRNDRKFIKSMKKEQSGYRVCWNRRLVSNLRILAKKKAWELMIKGKGKF